MADAVCHVHECMHAPPISRSPSTPAPHLRHAGVRVRADMHEEVDEASDGRFRQRMLAMHASERRKQVLKECAGARGRRELQSGGHAQQAFEQLQALGHLGQTGHGGAAASELRADLRAVSGQQVQRGLAEQLHERGMIH